MSKKGRKKRTGLPIIAAVVLFVFVFFTYKGTQLEKEKETLLQEQSELTEELEDEKERKDRLLDFEKYMQTLNYIEDIAREKLGLVKKDEIIYKIKEKEE
ncbi:MAG: septum formation initiator family protein [Lachnospiraceae bacterium]|nr:septum formation initiator family protein [Lachnospiraceae bacterium]